MNTPSEPNQPPESAGTPDVTVYETLLEAASVESEAGSADPLDSWPKYLRTSDEIMETDWPEPTWAIPGLLPVGLCFLAGAAKIGKSMLALQICLAISSGTAIFGEDVQKGRCLYLALEDPERRLKSRMVLQGWESGLQVDFLTIGSFTDRLGDLRRGGAERLGARIEAAGYRLVIIDTLSRAIQGDHNDNREMTEWLAPLQELAQNQGCAILVIDHHRKSSGFDPDAISDILGSTAKGAMADTVWGLYRERGKNSARFVITGREVSERTLHLLMDWETGTWRLDKDNGLTSQQREVLVKVRELEGATVSEIAEEVSRNRGSVHRQLEVLENHGLVYKRENIWRLTKLNE